MGGKHDPSARLATPMLRRLHRTVLVLALEEFSVKVDKTNTTLQMIL